MIARRSNRRLSLLQPQLLFNCVFDGAVVLLLRSRRSPGLGSLGFQDAPKDSTKKELRKWLARWNGSVKKGPGFHGVQQSYRKKGEEQGKGSGRLRCGGNAWGSARQRTQGGDCQYFWLLFIWRNDESDFPTTIWRIYGCVRRFIARKAGFYPYFIPRRLRSGGRNELYSLSY